MATEARTPSAGSATPTAGSGLRNRSFRSGTPATRPSKHVAPEPANVGWSTSTTTPAAVRSRIVAPMTRGPVPAGVMSTDGSSGLTGGAVVTQPAGGTPAVAPAV